MRSSTTAGGPSIHPSVLEYEAACSAFVDETALASTPTSAFPNAEPEYWLDAYPVLTEALANTESEPEYGAHEVALDLAIIVSVRAENSEPFADGDAVSIFLDRTVD